MREDVRHTVTRGIALAKAAEAAALTRAGAIPGVVAVHATVGARRLDVTYDLEGLDIGRLTEALAAVGLVPATGWLARVRRRWAAFQDGNLRDQAKIVHQCCNVPPKR